MYMYMYMYVYMYMYMQLCICFGFFTGFPCCRSASKGCAPPKRKGAWDRPEVNEMEATASGLRCGSPGQKAYLSSYKFLLYTYRVTQVYTYIHADIHAYKTYIYDIHI